MANPIIVAAAIRDLDNPPEDPMARQFRLLDEVLEDYAPALQELADYG